MRIDDPQRFCVVGTHGWYTDILDSVAVGKLNSKTCNYANHAGR